MKVVWFCHTPLAGMPHRTATVMNKALEPEGGWARCVCASPNSYGTRSYPQDILLSDPEAIDVIKEADLVIVPSYIKDQQFSGKPVARHLSTEPFRWIDKNPSASNHTVVAQYQARFAPHLDVLPNCIPISEPMWTPAEKPLNEIVIVYTPTSRQPVRRGWGSKGYEETMVALRRIARDYKDLVRIFFLENEPYEKVMAVRRRAHIVIDECATGSYHSTTLEGLSCGAVTICRIDSKTQDAINRLYGEETFLPVANSPLVELEDTIRTFMENPQLLTNAGEASREWMLKNYSEEWQAEKWVNWHRDFLKRSVPA